MFLLNKIKWFFQKLMPSSVFTKLVVILVLGGFLLMFLVGGLIRHTFSQDFRHQFQRNMHQYFNYVLTDIGTPPNLQKAKKIAKNIGVVIVYQGPSGGWSTSNKITKINPKKLEIWKHTKFGSFGELDDDNLVRINHQGGKVYFITQSKHRRFGLKKTMPIVGLLIGILLWMFFALKWVLKPIKALDKGVFELSKGNLEHIVEVNQKDELGDLALSFNAMTMRLKNMLYSKEKLLLDVSHELRSPLTRMQVASEFIEDTEIKNSLKEEIDQMSWMVTEMLETARLSSEHGKLNLQSTNIIELIKSSALKFKYQTPSINIITNLKLFNLLIDAHLISTVFNNVISNAYKHLENADKPLEILINKLDKHIEIIIKDYGIGIKESELPFIFEPFYRVDTSRTRETGGYGLGLSLCKTIINAHQGEINIESTYGQGTSVCLLLNI